MLYIKKLNNVLVHMAICVHACTCECTHLYVYSAVYMVDALTGRLGLGLAAQFCFQHSFKKCQHHA